MWDRISSGLLSLLAIQGLRMAIRQKKTMYQGHPHPDVYPYPRNAHTPQCQSWILLHLHNCRNTTQVSGVPTISASICTSPLYCASIQNMYSPIPLG